VIGVVASWDATARASPSGATTNAAPRRATAATAEQLSVAPSTIKEFSACIWVMPPSVQKIKNHYPERKAQIPIKMV
jgi:hypothetical protein